MNASFTQMLEAMQPHDHLCLIYESQEEWQAAVVPFIALGLGRGEKCIYVADAHTADEIRECLRQQGVDVTAVENAGQLTILHETEAYTREGTFDPDRMIALLISETDKAVAKGYPALRVTGEMTWVLRGHPGSERLLEYEAKLNRDFFPRYPCLAICQYDRWQFSSETIKGVVVTHPQLIRGNRVYRNFYYVPPEDFLNATRADREVQHWLNNLEREANLLDALRQSEERFRALFEMIPGGVFVHAGDRFLSVNSTMARISGYTREELLNMPFWNVMHPDDQELIKARGQARLRGEAVPSPYEAKILTKDGREGWVLIAASGISLAGEPSVWGTFIDITDLKQAQAASERKRQLLQALADAMPDFIYVKDAESRFLLCNRALLRMLGAASHQEVLGKTDADFFPADLAALYRADDQAVIASGQPLLNREETVRDPQGNEQWVLTTKVPFRDGEGRVIGLVGISRDITERKQAAESLRQREEEYRKLSQEFEGILDAIPDNLTLQDRELRILWTNEAAAQSVSKKPEDLVGQHCYGLWHNRTEPCESCPVAESFRTGMPAARVVETPDGRMWDLRTLPLADEHGTVTRVIELARNITEHRRLEEQYRQAQKMEAIGRLAGGVAHDFNNMLGVILGHANLALEQVTPAQTIYGDLMDIQKAAERSANLTRQLLAFARKQTVTPKVLDLNDTVAGMLKMLRRLIGEHIELAWRPGAALWPVKMDPAQVDQVLANLCINARDAITGVGRVAIETRNVPFDTAHCAHHEGSVPGDHVMLAVTDNGCGMSADVLEHVFEPFFTTKGLGRGTGLGLATVYGIVKQNEGFVDVSSELGKGTTIRLYLPRWTGKTPQGSAARVEEIAPGAGETVLVVEDEPALLELAKQMLEKLGYRVLAAARPGAALRMAEAHLGDIHLLVTDVVMPEMSGRELAERLRKIKPGVKWLFMSGYPDDEIALRGVLHVGVQFIQKPFSWPEMAAKIRELLRRP